MKLNELRDIKGAVKLRKRVGRGIGSGSGKTAGRGEKGQKSRSGVSVNGFEGGQMPIYRRLPKRGFKNKFSKDFAILSLGRIQSAIDSGKIDPSQIVDLAAIKTSGLVARLGDGVRILSTGEITTAVRFEVSGVSKAAREKIEKIGGSVTLLDEKTA